MNAPLSDERIAEIRERAESVKTWKAAFPEPVPQICDVDVPALLAEVERLRGDMERLIAEVTEERRRRASYVREVEVERDRLAEENEQLRARLGAAWTVVREGTANERAARAAITAERDQARTERAVARGQVDRVRALHPLERRHGKSVCGSCIGAYEEPLPYPCPTIAALDTEETNRG